MMASAAKDINWKYWGDALPAFLTLAVMPFTYSIAYGLIAGIVSYMVINTIIWLVELASFGHIVVPDKELREPWTYKIKGGLLPLWIVRAIRGYVSYSILLPLHMLTAH
jgi:AGZA family xanthine/uracil permease-like MFS transporter